MIEDGVNSFNVHVDGALTMIINTTKNINSYEIANNLSPQGSHNVVITRRTEALYGESKFLGFEVNDEAQLIAPTTPSRKIDFIGDSITCGYGILGTPPCNETTEVQDVSLSYGPIIANRLNADLSIQCWSGKGLVQTLLPQILFQSTKIELWLKL